MNKPEADYELTDAFHVPAGIEQVWRFFSTATNLPKITPPWLYFTITSPQPVIIQKDAVFDCTIRWMGIRASWRTRIIEWDPPRRFVDLQERGPYALWWHEHAFEPAGDGVMCRDRVLYKLPLGPIGWLTHRLFVQRQLREIFLYRRKVIGEALGGITPVQADISITPAPGSEARPGIPV